MDVNALTAKLIRTIEDPKHWYEALDALCKYVQADRALVSLRDSKTAEIVIPEDVSTAFASPLIHGFDKADVEAFLSDFGEIDPWTKIEREQHPYFPYAMSRYLSPSALRKTDFWHWLEPLGISECVVCELGRTEAYWAALNLYFDPADPSEIDTVLNRLKEVLPVLKSVWASGRALQAATTAVESLNIVLAAVEHPAAMVLQDGEILAMNEAMRLYLEADGRNALAGKRFPFPKNLKIDAQVGTAPLNFLNASPTGHTAVVSVRAHKAAQLKDGELRDTYLLTLEQQTESRGPQNAEVWQQEGLTPREKTLVKLAAEGMKFSEAQKEMGVSYPRIMQIWKSARDKLGVDDVNDLRLRHRLRRG